MNGVLHLTASMFLLYLVGTISPVFSSPKRTHASHILNTQIRNNDILRRHINSVDNYKVEAKERWSTKCMVYHHKDECHKSNDGCPKRSEECPTDLYGQRPACYALWKDDKKLLEGCWAPAQLCRRDCRAMHASLDLNFCCCYGDNCNERYGFANDIPAIQR